MVGPGSVRHGVAGFGSPSLIDRLAEVLFVAWLGRVRCGMVRYGTVCCGAFEVRCGMVRCVTVRYGTVWFAAHHRQVVSGAF